MEKVLRPTVGSVSCSEEGFVERGFPPAGLMSLGKAPSCARLGKK